jgi:hypothetical protein
VRYTSNAKRGKIIREYRSDMQKRYEKAIIGLFAPYSVVLGKSEKEIEEVLEKIKNDIQEYAKNDKESLEGKFQAAKKKFEFIGE